jgi:hypothetical protein
MGYQAEYEMNVTAEAVGLGHRDRAFSPAGIWPGQP